MVRKVICIYGHLSELHELLFYIEWIGFSFKSVPAGIQKLCPSFQSHAQRKENDGQQYTITNSPIQISFFFYEAQTKLKRVTMLQ